MPKNRHVTNGATSSSSNKNGRHNGATRLGTEGPDLNASRSPLDGKLYRQIMLPNGLRCVLISDTTAMMERDEAEEYEYEDDEDGPDDDAGDDADDDGHDNGGNSSHHRPAAVSIVVGAGSCQDTIPGLAHFLEHLLFMGSAKYPDENDYERFVSQHGGSDNAYTEWEYTTYYLTIPRHALWPALDRLAQFFISPLLLQSAVDRELQSIESEFQLNIQDDSVRQAQLLSGTMLASHPFAAFSWGNLRSLQAYPQYNGIDAMAELRRYFETNYYAANMRLVCVAGYPLDELQRSIETIFAPVPAVPPRDASNSANSVLPVDPALVGTWDGIATYQSPVAKAGEPRWSGSGEQDGGAQALLFRIVPIKEQHVLTLTFVLPSQFDHWRSKPADYLSHLLGHEGKGSVLSVLKQRNWVVSCSVGVGNEGHENASSHALLTAQFVLNVAGVDRWSDVVHVFFQYVGLLLRTAAQGWPPYLFDESKTMQQMSYEYGDEGSPEDIVENLIENLVPSYLLPPERLLDGPHLLFEFDAAAVQNILDRLRPHNMRVDLRSSSFGSHDDYSESVEHSMAMTVENLQMYPWTDDFDSRQHDPQIEPTFGIRFWCHAISAELLHSWDYAMQEDVSELFLPAPNPFLPKQLALKPLPVNDSHHALVNASIRVCIPVAKAKKWFAATVLQYDADKNAVRLSFEDEEEKWFRLDQTLAEWGAENLRPNCEGTMEQRSIKFRVHTLAKPGQGPIRRYGDEGDENAEDGLTFPPIPPALAANRVPKEVANTNQLKLWHLQDRTFRRPIADLRLQIICAEANRTPLHRACAELMVMLCEDLCTETAYLAELCELNYCLQAADYGFYLRVEGFDDRLLTLFESIMRVFLIFCGQTCALPPTISDEQFAACLERLQRRYKNAGLQASSLCNKLRLEALHPTLWSAHAKYQSTRALPAEVFARTASALLQQFAIEGLLHGNVDRNNAGLTRDLILQLVGNGNGKGLARKHYPKQSVVRVAAVPNGTTLCGPSSNSADPNTAVEVYIQVGKDNLRDRVLIDLLIHLMEELFFAQLRTLEQYGYDVHCDSRWTCGITGFIFKVVTNVQNATNVTQRIDKFLRDYRQLLVDMDSKSFLTHVVGLAHQKLELFSSLSEETDHLWGEIRDGRFAWQVWRDETVCLRSLTKSDVIAAYDQWLMPGQRSTGALIVQVIGTGAEVMRAERPEVPEEQDHGDFCDSRVSAVYQLCKGQTWGRVNAKLS